MIVPDSFDSRLDALRAWLAPLAPQFGLELTTLEPASADASFRRYFRVACSGGLHRSLIVMDAPPPRENTEPFIAVAKLMAQAGLHVPEILAHDTAAGFILLTDLGNTTYLTALQATRRQDNDAYADTLMRLAIDALVRWQLASQPQILPPYDEATLRQELALFPRWFIGRHYERSLTSTQSETLHAVFNQIVKANLAQPRVFVHRDYMPRNLMVCEPGPGVLDFQDARFGPISYDLVSLMRDAFISWQEERILDWTIYYWKRARAAGLPVSDDLGSFWRDFEWMGLQRHLKVLGIFARIRHRDHKPLYLSDAGRFISYVRSVAARYDALRPLLKLFDELKLDALSIRESLYVHGAHTQYS